MELSILPTTKARMLAMILHLQTTNLVDLTLILPTTDFYFAENVDQDQPAHSCSLILLCTLRSFIIDLNVNPNPRSLTNRQPGVYKCNRQTFNFGSTRLLTLILLN